MSLLKSLLENAAMQSLPTSGITSFRWFNPQGWLRGHIERYIQRKTKQPNPVAEQERIKANATAERLIAEAQAQAAAEIAKTEAAAEKIRNS
jgi:hypothetical protein